MFKNLYLFGVSLLQILSGIIRSLWQHVKTVNVAESVNSSSCLDGLPVKDTSPWHCKLPGQGPLALACQGPTGLGKEDAKAQLALTNQRGCQGPTGLGKPKRMPRHNWP
jgi:hypothetical protein